MYASAITAFTPKQLMAPSGEYEYNSQTIIKMMTLTFDL